MGRLITKKNIIIIAFIVISISFFISVLFIKKNVQAGDEINIKYYTSIEIEDGDTLWAIANTYMTDEYKDANEYIDEVKSINNISADYITEGCYIVVPYYAQAPNN